jgi:hypothetical protein
MCFTQPTIAGYCNTINLFIASYTKCVVHHHHQNNHHNHHRRQHHHSTVSTSALLLETN